MWALLVPNVIFSVVAPGYSPGPIPGVGPENSLSASKVTPMSSKSEPNDPKCLQSQQMGFVKICVLHN